MVIIIGIRDLLTYFKHTGLRAFTKLRSVCVHDLIWSYTVLLQSMRGGSCKVRVGCKGRLWSSEVNADGENKSVID